MNHVNGTCSNHEFPNFGISHPHRNGAGRFCKFFWKRKKLDVSLTLVSEGDAGGVLERVHRH